MIPTDVWQYILDHHIFNHSDIVKILMLNKYYYTTLKIHKIIFHKDTTNKHLANPIYNSVVYADFRGVKKVSDVSTMPYLRYLYANNKIKLSTVTSNTLVTLSTNKNIKALKNKSNLRTLISEHFSIENNYDFSGLDLEVFEMYERLECDISHMKNLHTLVVKHASDDALAKIDVEKVTILYEPNNVSHMQKLKELIISEHAESRNVAAPHLEKLIIKNGPYARISAPIPALPYLNELNISSFRYIRDDILENVNVVKLNISGCARISNISHMTRLRYLDCSGTEVDQKSIDKLSLTMLVMNNNKNIHSLRHMTGLKELYCSGPKVNITDESIKGLQLEVLIANDNRHITRKIVRKANDRRAYAFKK